MLFAPESDTTVFSFPSAMVAETLQERGWEVHTIFCNGVLKSFCTAMSARGLNAESQVGDLESVCHSCRRRQKLLSKKFNFTSHHIEDGLDDRTMGEIDVLVASVTLANWHEFKIDQVPIGRIAAYEFFLTYKLNSYEIPNELWGIYCKSLRNSLIVYFSVLNLLDEIKPDRVLLYNALYSVNNIVNVVAATKGIQTSAMHAGTHATRKFSTISLYRASTLPVLAYKSAEWKILQQVPLSNKLIDEVLMHFTEIFLARSVFVYSEKQMNLGPEKLFDFFKIPSTAKILLATMTSGDELFAAQLAGLLPMARGMSPIFESSLQWVRWLIEHAKNRPDLHIIIRIHPREFPNKREGVLSQYARLLESEFINLPANVSINWPDQKISLYDLAQIVDVCLNTTSSAGLELSALGIPVVLHDVEYMLAYDPKINTIVDAKDQYAAAIDRAISDGWCLENIRRAFRWWSFSFNCIAIDISEGFSYPANGYLNKGKSTQTKLINTLLVLAARIAQPKLDIRTLSTRRKLSNGALFDTAIREEGGVAMKTDYLSLDGSAIVRTSEDLSGVLSSLYDIFSSGGKIDSPLVQNLKTALAIEVVAHPRIDS